MIIKKMNKIIFLLTIAVTAGCGQSSGKAPDVAGVLSSSNNDSCSSGGKCKIFVTNNNYNNGLVGNNTTFDLECNNDTAKPSGGGTYKALVMTASRKPPSTNWVLYANRTYTRSDGSTIIGSTNADAIFFGDTTLINSIVALSDPRVWMTGIIVDHDGTWVTADGFNCTNFSSASSTIEFTYGKPAVSKDSWGFSFGPIQYVKCDGSENSTISVTNPHLLCVEQ